MEQTAARWTNRITRPTRRTSEQVIASPQPSRDGVETAGAQGRRSISPRESSVVSGDRTEWVVRLVIAAEKPADGVVGGTSFAEGLNAGKDA